MTAMEIRSEFFYEINPILDDENLMLKILNFVKSIKSARQDKIVANQQEFVKASLSRAFSELKQVERGEKELKTADEFIKELGL